MAIHDFSFNEPISNLPSFVDLRSDEEIAHPTYSVQDYDSPDIGMVVKMAEETINTSGAEVIVHARTNNGDIDEDWDEDPNPTYENPVIVKGFFVPQPLEQELTKWGVDQVNPVEIVFFRNHVFSQWKNRLLRSGDIIELPYNSATSSPPKYYRVDNAKETGNYRYMWLYVLCQCTLITGDPNIRPAHDNAEE